jgi:hypothetical protein
MKRKLMSRSAAAIFAMALAGSAVAETLLFDPDGAGPDAAVQVQVWDFLPGNVLAKDGVTAAGSGVGAPFTALGHSQLQALIFNGLPIAPSASLRLNVDYEITQVTTYGQTIDSLADLNNNGNPDVTAFRLNAGATPNFFEMWWSARDANSLAGTGYNNGIRILRGRVVNAYGTFLVNESSDPRVGGTPQVFDQSPNGNQYPGVLTLRGNGNTDPFTIEVLDFDPAFFPGLQAGNLLSFLVRVQNLSQNVPFVSTDPSEKFTGQEGGAPPAVTPLIGAINGLTGPDFQFQTDFNAVIQTVTRDDQTCRMTGGGVTVNGEMPLDGNGVPVLLAQGGSNKDRYQFGGQIGAPTAAQPQPFGEWTHHQQNGPDGSWVFHAGTHSAPDGTLIKQVTCRDPGFCRPARPAPFKQLDWQGIGKFNNLQKAPPVIKNNVVPGESLHWVKVHYEDLGEPGGPNGAQTKNANCTHKIGDIVGDPSTDPTAAATCSGCPDVYQITIYKKATDPAADPSNKPIYAVGGFIDHGNIQLHPAIKP